MCLSLPGKILSIDDSAALKMAVVDFGGVTREICIEWVPEANIGDYVLAHVGTALTVLDEESALESIAALNELSKVLEEEERNRIQAELEAKAKAWQEAEESRESTRFVTEISGKSGEEEETIPQDEIETSADTQRGLDIPEEPAVPETIRAANIQYERHQCTAITQNADKYSDTRQRPERISPQQVGNSRDRKRTGAQCDAGQI